MAVDPGTYREILTNFPSGVSVVTARGPDGGPLGLTVSAFCAVSVSPPLVLVCIDKTSATLSAIQGSGGFTVNLLAAGREELAMRFASKSEDKFSGLEWEASPIAEAGPVLTNDTVGYAVCRTDSAIEAGDHWIFVGAVEDGGIDPNEVPLVYARRRFADWDDVT
jgi:flavin reductase (DIM6/NTAB) family NADH-FMN oxidoreductase RutF